MWASIVSIFSSILSLFAQRNKDQNAPDVKAGKQNVEGEATHQQNVKDVAEAQKTGNLDKVRKGFEE